MSRSSPLRNCRVDTLVPVPGFPGRLAREEARDLPVSAHRVLDALVWTTYCSRTACRTPGLGTRRCLR
jgi:hypothetical protein